MRRSGIYEFALKESLKAVRCKNSSLKHIHGTGTDNVKSSVIKKISPESLIDIDSVNAEEENLRFFAENQSDLPNHSALVELKSVRFCAKYETNLNYKRNYKPEKEDKPDIYSRKTASLGNV